MNSNSHPAGNNGTETVLTVSELTADLKMMLSDQFSRVFVVGELAGVTFAKSGHVYFTLKDSQSQISGVIWKTTWLQLQRQKFKLADGLEMICGGRLDVYAARGSYQLTVNFLQPMGEGPLELAFRQLKEKLERDGLFALDRKRPLPALPQRIVVITSPTGAAVRDFLQVITHRWPNLEIIIIPVLVQGAQAAQQIARAFQAVERFATPPDVVVLTRGGGSLEDLWSFNEEIVCRAIFHCSVPVIAGIGHETDITLADLVADVRALTPSDAAARLVPQQADIRAQLDDLGNRLISSLERRYQTATLAVENLANRPAITRPLERINYLRMELDHLDQQVTERINNRIKQHQHQLQQLSGKLDAISPLTVLQRGYSLSTDEDGNLITSAKQIAAGSKMLTRVAKGTIVSSVESVESAESADSVESVESANNDRLDR